MDADGRTHDGADVLDPVARALLVILDGTSLEASNVALEHGTLVVIRRVFERLAQVRGGRGELGAVVAVLDDQLELRAVNVELVRLGGLVGGRDEEGELGRRVLADAECM